jgi:hypothetical protein
LTRGGEQRRSSSTEKPRTPLPKTQYVARPLLRSPIDPQPECCTSNAILLSGSRFARLKEQGIAAGLLDSTHGRAGNC